MAAGTVTVRSLQGDTVDLLCQRHLGTTTQGVVEATLSGNPGLSALGPVLPTGTAVVLQVPEVVIPSAASVQLWT